MAFTQIDLENINKAIATGALTVEVEGRKITYRSMTDLFRAKGSIESELAAQTTGKAAVRVSRVKFVRGC